MNFNFKTLFSTITFLIIGSYVVQGQNAYGKYYTNRSTTDFLSDSRLIMTVNPDSFDIDLINAALFHLSNLERIKKGEKPLDHFLDLEKSALLHSEEMSKHHFFSHSNTKNKKYKTPAVRIYLYNDNYRTVGENIVANNLIEYEGETLEYWRIQKDGEAIYVDENDSALKYTSYLNLAKRLTKQWMNSAPHKKNILSDEFTLLGCGCSLEDGEPFTKIKCTQNFGALFD